MGKSKVPHFCGPRCMSSFKLTVLPRQLSYAATTQLVSSSSATAAAAVLRARGRLDVLQGQREEGHWWGQPASSHSCTRPTACSDLV